MLGGCAYLPIPNPFLEQRMWRVWPPPAESGSGVSSCARQRHKADISPPRRGSQRPALSAFLARQVDRFRIEVVLVFVASGF